MAINFDGSEWLEIARRLERLSDKGALTWEKDPTAFNADVAFIATTPGGSSYVVSSVDFDGRFPYVLIVRDAHGADVASFKTSPFDDMGHYDDADEAASAVVTGLYQKVTRLVTGAPQMAKQLLDELDALDVPEDTPF